MKKVKSSKENIEDRIKYFGQRYDEDSVYKTNILDEQGINYKDFIKARAGVILDNSVALIGTEAWLILYYLMINANQKEYIRTSIRKVEFEINIKNCEKWLKILQNHKYIYINKLEDVEKDKIGKNELLEILVLYNNDEMFEFKNDKYRVYKALPTQYVRYLVNQLRLTHEEFAVYTVLVNYFRWFECKEYIDYKTEEVIYCYSQYEYAFPTQEQIAKKIGVSRNRIFNIIKCLSRKNLISYEPNKEIENTKVDENGKNIIKNINYRYKVKLLQRIEYVYFNYIALPDKRHESIKESIKSKGFDSIAKSDKHGILYDRDYLLFAYSDEINFFEKAIKTKATNYYFNMYNKTSIGIIKQFKNKNIDPIKKKIKRKKEEMESMYISTNDKKGESDYFDDDIIF